MVTARPFVLRMTRTNDVYLHVITFRRVDEPRSIAELERNMYVGTQVGARDDADLTQWAQLGVLNVCSDPREGNAHTWTRDDLASWREHVNSFGIELDMIQLPLSSTPIEVAEAPSIMLGIDPDRDREIEVVNTLIENCAAVGIPAVKYNMNLIGIPRSEREPGRGGSSNSTFRYEKVKHENQPGIAGEVSEDEFWERIDYFLERVVPLPKRTRYVWRATPTILTPLRDSVV